ncbi:hypothetical protein C922_04731 [Plasmodium inui San Antonio 1]|uniref:Uncharacterized protein n=1 Tax=Plasmodium inui San Antonio 1 TaxID=1237626 RepID=W6ZVT1_9APIC|nr:hypothetical protein C922_04731 [Plasmodium inui San Antonio 1]EUD64887.1 hypothetical protein C922_04731 [Plasmodium inui San Antonio 1]
MQRRRFPVLWRGCGGGVNRKGLGRSFTTHEGEDYKRNNAFEMWKCHSAETYRADLSFHDSFKISEDKELLLSTRVSKYKNVKHANIKFLFLFLTFSQPCCNHFLCKTNPRNAIRTQVLAKLNYLLLIKKILSNDSTQNRFINFLHLNYVLPRRGRNKVSLDEERTDDTYVGASPDGYPPLFGTKFLERDNPPRSTHDGNSHRAEHTNWVEPPRGVTNFRLNEIRQLFQKGEYEIVIHSNIKNRLLNHVYVDDLDGHIKTQINYLNMFVNQVTDKTMLLELYSFVDYFFGQMGKHANEFLFFLDRLADKLLPRMNLVDLAFIFHMHIKLNYYNHLFLFMLVRKMELLLLSLFTYPEGNKELANLYMRRIKYNQKSLVLFFHSLTNYFFYLNQLEGGTRYKDKQIHIERFLYGKLGALHVLQHMKRNYQSYSLLDYTLVFSSLNKLGIQNELLSSVLLDYIERIGSFLPTNANSQKGKLPTLTTSLSGGNLHLYASVLSTFTKCFKSYRYCRGQYERVMRVLLILFENGLWVISKLFVSEGKNLLCPRGDHKMAELRRPLSRSDLSVEESHSRMVTSQLDEQIKCANALNRKSDVPPEGENPNEKPTYFAFIKVLQLERRKSKVCNMGEAPSREACKEDSVPCRAGDSPDRPIHQTEVETYSYCKTVYHVQNVRDNIKFIVNCLNSTYKLVNHFIEMFKVKEHSKQFNRILLYNFCNQLIYEKEKIYHYGGYLDKLHNCTVHSSRLFDYREGRVHINRLFMCAYLQSFLLSDLVNVYVGGMVEGLRDGMPPTMGPSNESTFFSQLAANTLGAIQNLKLLRYDIFANITYILRREYFKLEVFNAGNIIHSFASVKLRDVQIIELLTKHLISHANDNLGSDHEIGEQTLSNVSISLLKLDFPNEKFNEIIFRNYKRVQSVHSLINITLYLCYYNFMSSLLLQNHFTHLFEHVNIADMSMLTVQNQTQLRLIALLTLYVHHYSAGERHKWEDAKGTPSGKISTHLNECGEVVLAPTISNKRGAQTAEGNYKVEHMGGRRQRSAFPDSGCTHVVPSSINMFEILAHKRMRNPPMETTPLLSERDYLNLHFIGAFPFSAPPIETTSSLHDEIYDVVASLSLPRRLTKELPHYPYYVDIVLA